MPWFKIDDNFWDHRKTIALDNAAIGLWARAGVWSARQLSDGHIPRVVLRRLGTRHQIRQLLDAGLWEPDPEGDGVHFHDWQDWQATRDLVQMRREAWADRQRRYRRRLRDTPEAEHKKQLNGHFSSTQSASDPNRNRDAEVIDIRRAPER